MKMLAMLLALCAACAMGQTVMVGDKAVTLDKITIPKRLFVISGLKFGLGKLVASGEDCTVVTGTLVSYLPSDKYDVTITITIVETRDDPAHANAGDSLVVTTTIHKPTPQKPVRFTVLGRGIYPHFTLRHNCSLEYAPVTAFGPAAGNVPKP